MQTLRRKKQPLINTQTCCDHSHSDKMKVLPVSRRSHAMVLDRAMSMTRHIHSGLSWLLTIPHCFGTW